MARLFTTGFELGEVIEHNAASWGPTTSSTYARTGTYSMACGFGAYFSHTLTHQPQEVYVRAAVMFRGGIASGVNNPDEYQAFMSLMVSSASHLSVALDAMTNRLLLMSGAGGALGHIPGTVLDRGDAVLRMNAWYVVELYAKIANSGGTATVKVNNTTDMSFVGDTAANANEYVEVVRFGTSISSTANTIHYTYLDDIAINDTTGDYQNSWAGYGGVYLLTPNADGTATDWTPSAGTTNYTQVDERPDDANTTYVTAELPGAKDLYGLTDLPATVTQVDLVQVVYQAALQEAGLNQMRDVIEHGGTVYGGYTQNITSEQPDYIFYAGTPWYTAPGGTTSWGTADVAGLYAGIEVV